MKFFSILVTLAASIALTGCSTSSDPSAALPKATVATKKIKDSERLNGETTFECVERIGLATGVYKKIGAKINEISEGTTPRLIKKCK